MKKFFDEFKSFLLEYKIIGLAIAFVVGVAATALVKSLVDNVIMPIITPFIAGGGWQTATFSMGPIIISWGAFLASLINFLIIALIVFIMSRSLFEKKAKKTAS